MRLTTYDQQITPLERVLLQKDRIRLSTGLLNIVGEDQEGTDSGYHKTAGSLPKPGGELERPYWVFHTESRARERRLERSHLLSKSPGIVCITSHRCIV